MTIPSSPQPCDEAPRSASGATAWLPLSLLATGAFSPVALIFSLIASWVIHRQTRWHWYWFALAGLVPIAITVAVVGNEDALERHFSAHAYALRYVSLAPFFSAESEFTVDAAWELVMVFMSRQGLLAVPGGVLAAALITFFEEQTAAGAPWSSAVRHRQAIDQRARFRRARRNLARPERHRGDIPVLGARLDGDLPGWVGGKHVVVPAQVRDKAIVVIGAPGAGKTVTLLRLAYIAGTLGLKVVFVDCKGTDPDLPDLLVTAYQRANPQARIGRWPDTPMSMWRGEPEQVVSRLMAVQDYTEPFYENAAAVMLRLALTAPGDEPIRSSGKLLDRMRLAALTNLWQGHHRAMEDIRSSGDYFHGVRMRYANFFGALGHAFDGDWSFEDVDLAIMTVPFLVSKSEADSAMRVLLEDYGHYATSRKPRTGEDAQLIIDEFSALQGGVPAAINLAERVRDVGAQVVVAAQSVEGLGDEQQARRLLAACAGGVILHRTADPTQLLRLAGTVLEVQQRWSIDHYGPIGLGQAQMGERTRIDPEQVRAAAAGEAWIIHAGRAVHLLVREPPRPDDRS